MGEGLVDHALTNRADLNQVLLGVPPEVPRRLYEGN
jgi:hypothetical protein